MTAFLSDITIDSIEDLASSDAAIKIGRDLSNDGKVGDLHVKENSIVAKVIDGEEIYNIVINVSNNHLYSYCSCAEDSMGCCHVVAVLYEWIQKSDRIASNSRPLLFQNMTLSDILSQQDPQSVMIAYRMVTDRKVSIKTHGEYVILGNAGAENVKIGTTIGTCSPRFFSSCSCKSTDTQCIHILAVQLAVLLRFNPQEVPHNFNIELQEMLYFERLNTLRRYFNRTVQEKSKRFYQIFFRIFLKSSELWIELCKSQLLKSGEYGRLTPATEEFLEKHFDSFPSDVKHIIVLMKMVLVKQTYYRMNQNNKLVLKIGTDSDDLEILGFMKTAYQENPELFRNIRFPEEKAFITFRIVQHLDDYELKMFVNTSRDEYDCRNVIIRGSKSQLWLAENSPRNHLSLYELDLVHDKFSLFRHLVESDPIRIKKADMLTFIENCFTGLCDIGNVLLPDEYNIDTEDAVVPVPRIYISEFGSRLILELRFGYGAESEVSFGTHHDIVVKDSDLRLQCIKRNPEIEKSFLEQLLENEVIRKFGVLTPQNDPYEWLLFTTGSLIQLGFEIYGQENLVKYRTTGIIPTLNMNVSSGIDWFDIKGEVVYGDEKIDFSKLVSAFAKNEKYIKLSNGVMGAIPEKWLEKFSKYSGLMKRKDDRVIASRSQIAMIQNLLEITTSFSIDEKIQLIIDKFKKFESIESVPLPEKFTGILRQYQKSGYDWLHFLNEFSFGGCLADDMGLGKTVQVLTLLQKLKEDGRSGISLIVVPTSLIHNWIEEIRKFTPELTVRIHHGNDRGTELPADSDVILTSYGILRNDLMLFKRQRFCYAILDESQTIKNPLSKTSRAVYSIRSDHRLIMTGTPIENSSMDLWSQFAFINPGLLGDFGYFRRTFLKGVEKDTEKSDALKKIIGPFVLSRKKDDVAGDLPPKQVMTLYCTMEEQQREVYENLRKKIRIEINDLVSEKGFLKSRWKILQGLIRLRQVCNHPGLIDRNYSGKSGKLEMMMENLRSILNSGHKVLVFSSFVKMLKIVQNQLDLDGIKYCYLDGHTVKRKEVIDDFQSEGGPPVFLISIKAGGLGLNLTEADYVFIVDPWWNPAVEMQAIDRTHRIGQKNHVFVYKMIVENSIEEKILLLQKNKQELFNRLINTDGTAFKKLGQEDMLQMFD